MTKELQHRAETRTMSKVASIALSIGAAVTLQGCIAAAFPLAAGGLLGERSLSRGGSDRAEPDPSVEVAVASRAGEVTNSDLAPVSPEPASAVPPPTSTSADFNDAFAQNAGTKAAEDQEPMPTRTVQDVASLSSSPGPISGPNPIAEPSATPSAGPSAGPSASEVVRPAAPAEGVRPLPTPVPSERTPLGPSGLGPAGINQLLSYANNRQIGTEERPFAAMLSDRVTLEPVKAQCGGVSPTILIDLDPDGALFDSKTASRPPSGLARGLAQLRESGVGVAWISGNGIDKLDPIKRALRFSGLDLTNEDRILLIRTADDRKQTLREELSQISCLIAIAGDTRSDFDELYNYLKNPSDAQSLEPLIGDGWFLIPQPLL